MSKYYPGSHPLTKESRLKCHVIYKAQNVSKIRIIFKEQHEDYRLGLVVKCWKYFIIVQSYTTLSFTKACGNENGYYVMISYQVLMQLLILYRPSSTRYSSLDRSQSWPPRSSDFNLEYSICASGATCRWL
jgi:hypothetical protein